MDRTTQRSAVAAIIFVLAFAKPSLAVEVKRVACNIRVTETIDIYGAPASAAAAAAIKTEIEQCWNGFRVDWCTITFDVTVRAYPNASTFFGTGIGGWDIELRPAIGRAYVRRATKTGLWSYATPLTPLDRYRFCHESGHIFGLPDDYSEPFFGPTIPKPGHAGHMMAVRFGAIVQHEIDDIVKNGGQSCPPGCCLVQGQTTIQDLDDEERFLAGR